MDDEGQASDQEPAPFVSQPVSGREMCDYKISSEVKQYRILSCRVVSLHVFSSF